MHPRFVVLAAAVLAACGGGAARGDGRTSGAGAASIACGPASAHTLVANREARIYTSGTGVYGCAHGGHRSHRLGSSQRSLREGRVGPVALGGVDAGYALTFFGVDTGTSQVVVRRLSDGHRLRELSALTKPQGPESFSSLDAIVVKADGTVAWIATGRSIIGHGQDTEVHRADGRGAALLDSGAAIAPRSLRLRESQLTWRDGSATRSATLQ